MNIKKLFVAAAAALTLAACGAAQSSNSGSNASTEAKKEVKMLENNKENLTDLLDLYTRQLEYGKKDFKLRGSEK